MQLVNVVARGSWHSGGWGGYKESGWLSGERFLAGSYWLFSFPLTCQKYFFTWMNYEILTTCDVFSFYLLSAKMFVYLCAVDVRWKCVPSSCWIDGCLMSCLWCNCGDMSAYMQGTGILPLCRKCFRILQIHARTLNSIKISNLFIVFKDHI